MSNALVKTLGFPATLIQGDPMVLDRWRWLKRRLPRTNDKLRLLDVGCGSGGFTIGASLRGYEAWGLSWDDANNQKATERARVCNAPNASFSIQDIRYLSERDDLKNQFDVAICLECIEHIIDDRRLVCAIADCLKPGGRLLITTPNYHYHAIDDHDNGPFSKIEDGWHVRRGYTKAMFHQLCQESGLMVEDISFCSGYISQKITRYDRILRKLVGHRCSWLALAPARIGPLMFDGVIRTTTNWPDYSIGLEAYKPRV